MAINKFKALTNWLQNYADLSDWLYFNTSADINGSASVYTIGGDTKLKKYIDGSYDAAFTFAVEVVKGYDVEQSNLNVEALDEVTSLMNWVDSCDTALDFGPEYIITDIEVLEQTPSISVGQTEDGENVARYSFNMKVYYTFNIIEEEIDTYE